MSQILDALKKLDREHAFIRLGQGPIATEVLKARPLRPPKRFLRYTLYILLTAVITLSLIYGLTVESGFLWKSPSPASEIAPAPGPQLAQLPPTVADTPKPLPPAPVKSPDAVQKITPPPPKATSVPRSSLSKAPSPDAPLPKSAPHPLVSSLPPKTSSLPPVQLPAPKEEDSDNPQEGAPNNISPETLEYAKRVRQMQQALRQQREAIKRGLPVERNIPPPPMIGGTDSPSTPQTPGGFPWGSPQAAAPSPNASGEGAPRLKISGIIWNIEPAIRRAFVNGSFISEGSEIEGVKVVEIRPTGVRFSYKGRVFEISAFD